MTGCFPNFPFFLGSVELSDFLKSLPARSEPLGDHDASRAICPVLFSLEAEMRAELHGPGAAGTEISSTAIGGLSKALVV